MTAHPEQTAAGTPASPAVTEGFPRPFGSRYYLLKELGKGGMGHVFMAVSGERDIQRVCSLKIIRHLVDPGRGPDELARRFADEARVVTKLSQENLVYVFDFGVVGSQGQEQGYLAMEYLRGKTLTEVWNRCALKQVGFQLGATLFVVSEVAAGLAYAHSLPQFDLVHRDISPSNVMVTYTGGVKLIDFGLAKWNRKSSQTMTGINWGKVSYMSPEQYSGRKIDHRSDIFSLGVILWELLTGRQLFPSEDGRRKSDAIVPPSTFNNAVSPELDRVVMKALAQDPADRFQGAAGFGQSLLRFMPKNAGKLDLAHFMQRLFEADARKEDAEEERLLARVSEMRRAPPALENAEAPVPTPAPALAAADRDSLVGALLADRYFVKRKIGEGSMGQVYEGHHTGIGKRVAIKVPRHADRRRSKLLQRFRLEATAASQIGHINIADVTDCGTTPGGDFFFVMEYLDGVDLGKRLAQEGALDLERTLLVAIQICRALEAAHKAGIIHRDLKPSNVMLVRDREDNELVKVLDFGVAKFLRNTNDELTQADAAIGTPRYMAPEQIESGKTVDFRVDIYAMGGLIYAMLSGGRAPFEAAGVEEVWRLKTTSDPVPLRQWRSDLPEDLDTLVMGCLMRDPALRPQSMEALKRELLRVLEDVRQAGSSVLAMRPPSSSTAAVVTETSPEPPVRTSSRWRLIVASAAGLSVLVLLALLVSRNRAPSPEGMAREAVPAPVTMPAMRPEAATPVPEAPPPAPAAVPAAPAQEPVAITPAPASAKPALAVAMPPKPPSPPRAPSDIAAAAKGAAPAPEGSRERARNSRGQTDEKTAALLVEAELAFRRGQLAEAAALGEKIVARRPDLGGYLLLGKAYLFLEQPAKAVRAYERALKLSPDNAAAVRGLEKARTSAGGAQ